MQEPSKHARTTHKQEYNRDYQRLRGQRHKRQGHPRCFKQSSYNHPRPILPNPPQPQARIKGLQGTQFNFYLLITAQQVPQPIRQTSIQPIPQDHRSSQLLLPTHRTHIKAYTVPVSIRSSLNRGPTKSSKLIRDQQARVIQR